MDAEELMRLADDIKYLKEEIEVNNPLFGKCPDGNVTLDGLIKYCKDNDHILEHVIKVARRFNSIG